jgi:RHS repeat-associated protein
MKMICYSVAAQFLDVLLRRERSGDFKPILCPSLSLFILLCLPAFVMGQSTVPVDLSSLVNQDLDNYTNGNDYPPDGGPLSVGGVPFTLTSAGYTAIIQSNGAETFSIPVGIKGVVTVYTLINSAEGECGTQVGELDFVGASSPPFVYTLTEGENIRDHNQYVFCNTASDIADTANFAGGQVRLDMQEITLPASFADDTLVQILFKSYGAGYGGQPFVAAITVSGTDLAKSQGATCDVPGGSSCGDPISIGNGNVFESVTDYQTAGQNKLSFTRFYNSLGSSTTFAASLGKHWRSAFDRYIRIASASSVAVERADGQQLTFRLSGSNWKTDSDIDLSLTHSGSTWTLTDQDDTVETYKAINSNEALLSQIAMRNGYMQDLEYNSSNQLTTVTDSYKRALMFGYSNGLLQTITTPDNTTFTYGFSSSGVTTGVLDLLTSISFSTNPVTSETYVYGNPSLPYALTAIIDENGKHFSAWTYDNSGRALTSQHAEGADLTSVTYDDSNGSRTVTNALGVTDTYTFTVLQGAPKITEISRAKTATTAAATESFTYDKNGYTSSKTDWNGNKMTYVTNIHGLPTTIDEATGTSVARTTTITYDPKWVRLPETIVTPGLTTSFTYNGYGEVLTKKLTDTTTTTIPYSTKGQTRTWTNTWSDSLLASTKTPKGNETKYGYDSTGALSSTTNAYGKVIKITAHTGGGLPETIVDPNGVTTTQTYDARLNLQTSTLDTAAGKLTTTYEHGRANSLISIQQPDGSKMDYVYDSAHRLTSSTDGLGNRIVYTLDALGDPTLIEIQNKSGAVTKRHTASFDKLGRKIEDVGGSGQATAYTYDNNSNVLTVTPPAPSGVIRYSYDALNRRFTAKDPAPGGTTTSIYDPHDRLLSLKDANGHTTAYVYDGFGDRIQTASPDSGTTVYRFDADGNQTQIVRPGPQTQNATFDALDRPVSTTFPTDSTLNVSRSYGQAGHGFGIGRLTSVTDKVGTLSLTYDERGNVTQETRVVTGAGTLKTTTLYDAVSRVAGITYPSGTKVAYGRDSMGRVTEILAAAPGAPTPSTVVSGVTYEPFGPETALDFGNGIKGAYSYDLDYRPLVRAETGAAAVQELSYTYYANNSARSITDGVDGRNSQAFGYDLLDRLTSAISGAGGYGSQTFKWDPVGNISSRVFSGKSTTFSYVPGSNKLAQVQEAGSDPEVVASTPAGNILGESINKVSIESSTYNQANRLATAVTTTMGTYSYDLFGHRLKKALPGQYPILYQFGRNDGQLLSENDLHKGQAADYIYLNGRPIGEIDPTSGKLYFTHTDRLGTPQKLTDTSQKLVWSALYQPFGSTGMTVNALITQSLRLPGQQFDPETELNHNGFRDYSTELGRYVESDPIGLGGGINTFKYVDGDPLNKVDPSGLAVIFIGGYGDGDSDRPVKKYFDSYHKKHSDSYYFNWDQEDDILHLIMNLQTGEPITLIGHSYGGDTAADVAKDSCKRISQLITIDPVSQDPPDYKDVKANVDYWADVDATGGGSFNGSNWIAGIGGEWGSSPKGVADFFVEAPEPHGNFAKLLAYAPLAQY